jgi:hypothetical protein
VVITAAIWSVRNPIKCYSTQQSVAIATIVRWSYCKELLRESVLHFGVHTSIALAFYVYLTLIKWWNVIQCVSFIVVPEHRSSHGNSQRMHAVYANTAAVLGGTIKGTVCGRKIRINFIFTQHLYLTPMRRADNRLNGTPLTPDSGVRAART